MRGKLLTIKITTHRICYAGLLLSPAEDSHLPYILWEIWRATRKLQQCQSDETVVSAMTRIFHCSSVFHTILDFENMGINEYEEKNNQSIYFICSFNVMWLITFELIILSLVQVFLLHCFIIFFPINAFSLRFSLQCLIMAKSKLDILQFKTVKHKCWHLTKCVIWVIRYFFCIIVPSLHHKANWLVILKTLLYGKKTKTKLNSIFRGRQSYGIKLGTYL